MAQKNVNHEIIVVDDNSTDNTEEVMQSFVINPRIKFIKNKKNLGVAATANIGFKASRSQFVIRVDADDFVNASMCFFMITYLEANHDAFCVSCDYELIYQYENII